MTDVDIKKEMAKLSKTKRDRVPVQIVIDRGTKHIFAENVIHRNYTRYTIAEYDESLMVGAHGDADAVIDQMFNFDVGGVQLSDEAGDMQLFSEVMQEEDDILGMWAEMDDGGFDDYDEEDPNSELCENTDNEITVINDASVEDDNITIKHHGKYSGNHWVEGKGYITYDEYTTSVDELTLRKLSAGDERAFMELDEELLPLTTFHASKGVRRTNDNSEIVVGSTSVLKVLRYTNRSNDTLVETYDINNNLLQQEFKGSQGHITVNYKVKSNLYGNPGGKFFFGTTKFPIDYTETVLELKAVNSKAQKEKQAFRIRKNRRCLYLPNIQYFKNRLRLEHVEKANYLIVDDPLELRRYCDYLLSSSMMGKILAYDAETRGLRFHKWIPEHTKHTLVTHSLSWEDNQSIIVPVRMKYCKNIRPEEAAEMLKPVLERSQILAHNGSADVRFLKEEGINLNLKEDTMHLIKHLIPFVNHRDVIGFSKALDDLVSRAFGVDMIDLNKYVFKPSGVEFDFSLLNEAYMIYYGCPDTDLDRQLWKGLRPKLAPEQELAYRYTVEFSKQMALHGTYSGMGVDEESIKTERAEAQAVVDILEETIYAITGESRKTLSLTSAPQKCTYVFGKMGAPKEFARVTSQGKLSADKVVIERLGSIKSEVPQDIFKEDILDEAGDIVLTAEELNACKFPFCKLVRKHGDLTKNITAFFNGILNSSVEGVYYPDYRIGATDTWRTTDRIQITKKHVKGFIGNMENPVAGKDRFGWFSTDYAAEEFRLAANGSEDWALIDMLIDHEADPHTMVASELFKLPPYKVSGDLRGQTKSCNFGIIYGMKPKRLACSINRVDEPTKDMIAVATDLYDLYCYKRALMLQPLEQAKETVREYGWLDNKLGYRMVYYQVIDVKEYIGRVFDFSEAEYGKVPEVIVDPDLKRKYLGELLNACGNYPIQSWAGGTLMEVFVNHANLLEREGLSEYVTLPLSVHDEVGGNYDKHVVHPYRYIKLQNESLVTDLPYLNKEKVAPLYIGIGFGKSWGEAKKDEYEVPVHLQHLLIEEYENGTAPSIEEINKEGAKEHFFRRIKEYTRGRVSELFADMIESKHFNRQEMQHMLNKNMFIGKKVNELFKTNDKKTMEIILEKYLEVIFDGKSLEQLREEGYTWEEGEPILEEWEKEVDADEVQDFFFLPQIHPRLVVEKKTVSVNLRGIYHPIVVNAIQYIKSLCEPESIHSKTVIIATDQGNIFLEEKILGMPSNFSEVFDKVLTGATVHVLPRQEGRRVPKIVLKENPVLYQGEDGLYKVIINATLCNQIHQELFNNIATIINKFVSTSVLAKIPIIIRGEYEADTGLRLVSINVQMQEAINTVVDYYLAMSPMQTTQEIEPVYETTETEEGREWVPIDKYGVM